MTAVQKRLAALGVLSEQAVSPLPFDFQSRKDIVSWLENSPYSPYVTLYGGESSLTYNEKESFVAPHDGKKRYMLRGEIFFKFENFLNFGSEIMSANARLCDVVKAERLFEAYPNFKDISVSINISQAHNGAMSGENRYKDGHIEVFASSNEDAMRVLLHELQHSIQYKEGFKMGASYYGNVGEMDMFVGSTADKFGNYESGSFSDMSIGETIREISDSSTKLNMKKLSELKIDWHKHGNPPSLDEIFEAKELYVLYPQLKDIKIHSMTFYDGTLASFNAKDKTIAIDFPASYDVDYEKKMQQIKSTLLHELQHAVQDIEKWARGGSVKEFEKNLNEETIGLMLSNLGEALFLKEFSEKHNIPVDKVHFREGTYGYDILQNKDAIRIAKNNSFEYLQKEYDELRSTNFENYQRLWGEQQARAVQYRANMSDKQREGESWTDTLLRKEGKLGEPLVKFTSNEIMQAVELERKYLDSKGKLDENLIFADGADRLPRYFTSYEKFKNLFKNQISDRYAIVKSPIGDVKIHMKSTFNHFTDNTNKQNRIRYSGGLLPALENPLFIIKDNHDGKEARVFYKPMVSKNKKEGLMHFAAFAVNDKGYLENSTYFDIPMWKLEKYIKTKEENLVYFKHAGSHPKCALSESLLASEKTRASDVIISSSTDNVNSISKEERNKNFKEWFGDSKVVDESGEPLVVYHGTGESFNKFSVCPASWVSTSSKHANRYADKHVPDWKTGKNNVMPLYVSIKNPYQFNVGEFAKTTERELMIDMLMSVENKKSLGSDTIESIERLIRGASRTTEQACLIWNSSENLKKAATILGYDGYAAFEVDSNMNEKREYYKTFAAFESSQLKSIHNSGYFSTQSPDILEKNEYGLNRLEKALSIVKDGTPLGTVDEYLSFCGFGKELVEKSVFANSFKKEGFVNPLRFNKGLIDKTSAYYNNAGEIEAREIEELYISASKIEISPAVEVMSGEELRAAADEIAARGEKRRLEVVKR